MDKVKLPDGWGLINGKPFGKFECNDCETLRKRVAVLEEQLASAIVPKHKVGDDVWIVLHMPQRIRKGDVTRFIITNVVGKRHEISYVIRVFDELGCTEYVKHGEIFATEQEARAELSSDGGGKWT